MKERENLMEEQEFKDYLSNSLNLIYFDGVGRFRSIQRAYRRGLVTNLGYIVPSRPFHNRKNTCKRGKHSRKFNEEKKRAFYELRKFNHTGVQ